jgi:CRP-like cAMP-binding protein
LEALTESTFTIQYGQDSINEQDDFLTEWLIALHLARHPVNAEERLLNLLKLLVYRLGRRTRDGCTLNFLLSHARLAEIIGATRSTVSRAMGKLRQNGSISIEESKGLLTIRD